MSIFDNLLATAMMGEGGGGGGGGSSDFSTATVTITNTKEDSTIRIGGVCVYNDEELSTDNYVDYGTNKITVVLFKGSQITYIDAETITSTEGSVTGSLEDGFTVTGDCTIVGEGFGIQ